DEIADVAFPQVEDYSKFRAHRRIERNRKLVTLVKSRHSPKCVLCELTLEQIYGVVGRGYIEAHHVIPISERRGQRVEIDPKRDFKPDGYNIGINIGEAAGQSVWHVHVHVIPRYVGDVENPRGGVRGVIPLKQQY